MENNQSSSPIFSNSRQDENKQFKAEMKRVFAALDKHPKTMLMVSIETGILRANICRYVAEWEKENRIKLVRKSICSISKRRAGFYTTNLELIPANVQPLNTDKP